MRFSKSINFRCECYIHTVSAYIIDKIVCDESRTGTGGLRMRLQKECSDLNEQRSTVSYLLWTDGLLKWPKHRLQNSKYMSGSTLYLVVCARVL